MRAIALLAVPMPLDDMVTADHTVSCISCFRMEQF
jgi:hypothetical protein